MNDRVSAKRRSLRESEWAFARPSLDFTARRPLLRRRWRHFSLQPFMSAVIITLLRVQSRVWHFCHIIFCPCGACSRRDRICFRGRCAPNWQNNYRCTSHEAGFGTCRNDGRLSPAKLPGIIKAIYQLYSPEGCARRSIKPLFFNELHGIFIRFFNSDAKANATLHNCQSAKLTIVAKSVMRDLIISCPNCYSNLRNVNWLK